jgi:rod shape determining protein RodA
MVDVNISGTGRSVFAGAPYRAAGKTGTAQVIAIKANEKYDASKVDERHRDHSLYIAFAPAGPGEQPVIAIAALVENGGFGARAAAPIVRAAFDYFLLGKLPQGMAPLQGDRLPPEAAQPQQAPRLAQAADRCAVNDVALKQPWQRSPLALWLRDRLLVLDPALLAIIGALALIGLVTLYSAANDFPWRFTDQLRNFAIAAAVMFIAANVPPPTLQKLALPLYLVGVLLLVGVEVAGVTVKGATRWLDIGVTRIQPSEMMRLALPLMLAWYFHRREGAPRPLDFMVAAVLMAVPVALIVKQPDLGTSLLVLAAGLYVIFFAGLPWKWLATLAIGGLAMLPVLWSMMHDYQRTRVLTLIDPTADPLGKGFHTLQATIAIGSGGAFGKGWMQGTQTHLEFIPERTSDFIFAVFSEEFGLVGNVVLMSPVPGAGGARAADRRQRIDHLLAPARGLDRADHLHLCVRQHGHGQRPAAGGGRAAALHQLRRHRAGDTGRGLRHADEHQSPPQAGTELNDMMATSSPPCTRVLMAMLLAIAIAGCGTAPKPPCGRNRGRAASTRTTARRCRCRPTSWPRRTRRRGSSRSTAAPAGRTSRSGEATRRSPTIARSFSAASPPGTGASSTATGPRLARSTTCSR